MSESAPSDLVDEMYCAVAEEAALWEFPLGATEPDADGGLVTYGPWDPAECPRQLLEWFEADLIELYAD